jgi:hypothetical protein
MSGGADIQRAEGVQTAKLVLTGRTQFSLQEVVLTHEGVEFIDENGGGPGVRLRKPNETKSKKK